MIFGATAFCETPFASQIKNDNIFIVTGSELSFATGTVNVLSKVRVDGVRMDLANNPVSVIVWSEIDPNAEQIWTPIDPDE